MNKDNKIISEAYFNEIFDSSYNLEHSVSHDPPYNFSYKFRNDEGKVYYISFELDTRTGPFGVGAELPKVYLFEFFYVEGSIHHDLTGSGDEFKVFSTVIKSIKLFYDELKEEGRELEEIVFSASKKEPSRIKLYERLLKTLAKERDFNYKITPKVGAVFFSLYPTTFKNEYEKL